MWDDSSRAQKSPSEIHCHHLVPKFTSEAGYRRSWSCNPSVVDEDVNSPKRLHRGADHFIHLSFVGDISYSAQRTTAERVDRSCGFFKNVSLTPADKYVGALACKCE